MKTSRNYTVYRE